MKKEVPRAEASSVAGDVGDAEAVKRMIAAVPQADILVNNAGPIEPKLLFEIPDEDWERFFQVVAMGPVRLC